MRIVTFLAAALLLAGGLATTATADTTGPSESRTEPASGRNQAMDDGETVKFEVLKTGTNAFGFDKPAEKLIQTEAEWAELWKALESTTVPRPPVQPVDFKKSTLVAVFMGEKRTGGYSITVDAVSSMDTVSDDPKDKGGKALTVRVTESSPGKGTITTQAFTSPYQVIAIPHDEYSLSVVRSAK